MPAAKPPPARLREEPDPAFQRAFARLLAGVGVRIREARERTGNSQTALAAKSGTAPSYWNAVEHARKKVSLETLARFAAALDVDVADLIPRRDELTEEGRGPGEPKAKRR